MHMCLYLNTGSLKNVHTEIKPKAFVMLRQPSSTELHQFSAKEALTPTPTCAKVSLIVQFSPWPH